MEPRGSCYGGFRQVSLPFEQKQHGSSQPRGKHEILYYSRSLSFPHYSVCHFFLKLVQVLENYSAGSKGNVYWGDSIIVAVAPSRELGIGLSKHQIKYKRRSFEADQNAGIFIHSLTQLTHSSHSCTHSLTHSRPHSLTHSLTPLWYQ